MRANDTALTSKTERGVGRQRQPNSAMVTVNEGVDSGSIVKACSKKAVYSAIDTTEEDTMQEYQPEKVPGR